SKEAPVPAAIPAPNQAFPWDTRRRAALGHLPLPALPEAPQALLPLSSGPSHLP
ncbi:unnamed protein product, partial [Coccothraustes coccothraustes]